jgi:hypothetical protein
MITLAVALWFAYYVMVTGPAFDERRARRRARRDFPKARVEFLLPSTGRAPCSCGSHSCPLAR